MTNFAINATQVTKEFGTLRAIDKLDLAVEENTIYGFLGPNGCGKTTAIRILTGLLIPTSGSINVLGYQLPQESLKLRLKIGYMTQKFSLYDDLTIRENLNFMAKIYSITGKERDQRIERLLSTYNLKAKEKHLAGSMSGGQKQRLALAGATIHQPKLLFLDEPTSAVDPENRRDFWEKLFDLCDQGTTILVSTHYMDEAERCHRIAILENGIKRADNSPSKLMNEMNAHVVEIAAENLRQIKDQLVNLEHIISVAQLGARLRVLVNKTISDPLDYINTLDFIKTEHNDMSHNALPAKNTVEHVRANLEDVFVTCTGNRML